MCVALQPKIDYRAVCALVSGCVLSEYKVYRFPLRVCCLLVGCQELGFFLGEVGLLAEQEIVSRYSECSCEHTECACPYALCPA